MLNFTRTSGRAAIGSILAITALAHAAEPPQIETKIESVGLFKNGLAVVRRTVTLPPGEGNVFDLTDLPEPVHGTFWMESTAELTVTMTRADVAADVEPVALPRMDNHSLAGSRVAVYFKGEHLPAIEGVVATPPAPTAPRWDTSYGWAQPRHEWMWSGMTRHHGSTYTPPAGQHLVLETDDGEIVLDTASIAYVRVESRSARPKGMQAVLRVAVERAHDEESIDVGILYLTKGASWAPSYEVALGDTSQLTLRQSAVIRNELEDWHEVELMLISGFPSIEFGHVLSPMSPATDLARFFRALGDQPRLSHSSRGDVMSQTMMYNDVMPALDIDFARIENPSLAGADLHYHSIGRRSLKRGDTMLIETARSATTGEAIVQWRVPDDRDQWGHRKSNTYSYASLGNEGSPEVWDAIRFRNPLERALTTAPAMVVKDGLVRGQGMLYWAAPGEQTVLPFNKTLSVRAWVNEFEVDDAREEVRMYGRIFWRTTVNGVVTLINQRVEPVTAVVRLEFSGDLVEADAEPVTTLRSDGVWSLNPRRQMTWTIELEPGETREVPYSYTVLAPR